MLEQFATTSTRNVDVLVGAIQRLSQAHSLEEVQAAVAHAARALTGADGATFVLRDEGNCYYADEEAIGPLWKGKRFPMTACITGWSMLHRAPAVIPDIYRDPRIPVEAYRPTFVKSLAVVPIRRADPIGAIGNYWAEPHTATDAELHDLQTLADSASTAIANVTLLRELVAARETAERSSRLKDEFLAIVSHELRTPLNAIAGWAQVLEAGCDETDRLEAAETIRRNAFVQARLIDDLLDASLMVTSHLRIERERVELGSLVKSALDDARPDAAAKKVQVAIDGWSRPLHVTGDALRLRQVVSNLLANAIKFTPAGGTIEIRGSREPGLARIAVRDDGIGIAPEFLPLVFERFRQADGSTTRRHGGLGLGLAIAKHIVELHGGRIRAESPGLARGATFTIELPVASAT